jgi:uncharacterized protein
VRPFSLSDRSFGLLMVVAVAVVLAGCGPDAQLEDAGETPVPASPADPDVLESPTPQPRVPALHPEVDAMEATVVLVAGRGGADEARVDVRVASSSTERQRGLMHVPELPDGTGMLFVFEEPRAGGFWMKDTLVPLDIAFADDAGVIVAILTMEPCEADPCPTYDPEVTYTYALEVPAGWFERAGVEAGDRLRFDDPAPAEPDDRAASVG